MRTLAWILCVAAACDAGVKPEPAAAPTKSPTKTTVTTKPVATSAFDLEYLPANSDVIMHVDVAKLRQSKLWPTYSKHVGRIFAPGFADCELDPMTTLSTIDIGITVGDEYPNVFVLRGIDHHRAMACFNSLDGKGHYKATTEGEFITLTNAAGKKRVLTFVDKTTMVMRTTKGPEQGLQQVLQQGAPLEKNAGLVAAMQKVNTKAAIVAVSRPDSEALVKQMSQTGVKLAYLYGSIDLMDHLDLQYAMSMPTTDDATQIATMLKTQFDSPGVKQMFDRIETHTQGTTVTLDISMSEPKLASLTGMLTSMIPDS